MLPKLVALFMFAMEQGAAKFRFLMQRFLESFLLQEYIEI